MESNFITFDEFVRRIASARHEDFVARGAVVSDRAEFEKMRRHILSLYEGVSVKHSFIEHAGSYADCIPIDQQPGRRATGGKIAEPPAFFSKSAVPPAGATPVQAPLRRGAKDRFGNEQYCPAGTIPMRRLTLEEVSRFESLDHFFQRGRWAKGHPVETRRNGRDASSGHRYAHAYQTVNNNGGYTWLNGWDPNPSPGVFSLSQCWYSAFNAAQQVQTVECGWQVYPNKYSAAGPVLFSYWTADGYQNTGNYNLDAPAFVQTNNSWVLGGAFPNWTTPGGGQNVGFGVEYNQDSSGNWWLGIGGGAGSFTPIGYYPASLWSGTQMASFATGIDYGGEVAPSDGSAATGQMGSGAFASAGFGNAAYQSAIGYVPQGGSSLVAATLSINQTNPDYYTIQGVNNDPDNGTSFYFGGPGGA
jgi:hypothetical protein